MQGQRQARRADHLDGLLPRDVGLPASRVVAEDPRREEAGGRKGEPAERSPDDVLRAGGARESGPEGGVRAGRRVGVEEREVGVLLRRLDQAGAEARLAQDGFEVLREQVAREVELARAEALGDRGGRQVRLELDAIEARRLFQ